MKQKYKIPREQMKNIKKIDEGIFLKNVYRVADPAPYKFHRATKEPTKPLQGVQLPLVPLPQEQLQLHQLEQPQEQRPHQQDQLPDQPRGQLPVQPRGASLPPRSRKIYLLQREAGDLSYQSAKEKWQEEENTKLKKWIKFQGQIIFAQSERKRLMEVEFAKTDEERSREVKIATTKMLKHISKGHDMK